MKKFSYSILQIWLVYPLYHFLPIYSLEKVIHRAVIFYDLTGTPIS